MCQDKNGNLNNMLYGRGKECGTFSSVSFGVPAVDCG